MTDQPMPASGDGRSKGAPDGVSGAPGKASAPAADNARGVHGRTEGGESGGANYHNPQTGKAGATGQGGATEPGSGHGSGFGDGPSGHGGQTQIDYYGSGQRGAGGAAAQNAVAGSSSSGHDDAAKAPPPTAERPSHQVTAQGRTFAVVEDSGIAAAEAAGDLGPGAANDDKDSDKAG